MMFCCFPYGGLALTCLFGVFCYVVLQFGPNCDDDMCRSEGVDNAPLAWASNFFIAGVFLVLGIHICFNRRGLGKAFVAFLSWSVSHCIWGIVALGFGNDGTLDGKGERGYFILNMLGYVFATESLIEMAGLAMRLWVTILPDYRPICCGRSYLRCFEVLVTLTVLFIASGSLWCSAIPDVWARAPVDDYPNEMEYSDIHTCIKMVDIGQVVFTGVSALFWVAVASIYGSSARQELEEYEQWHYMWGLPASLSAAAVICFQTMILAFHLMAFSLQRSAGAEPDDDIATTATIAYHYSILMTGFFAHNFIFSLSIAKASSNHAKFYNDQDDSEAGDEASADNSFFGHVKIIPSSSTGLPHYHRDDEASTSSSSQTDISENDEETFRTVGRSLLDDAATVIETVYSESSDRAVDFEEEEEQQQRSSIQRIAKSMEVVPAIPSPATTTANVDPEESCTESTTACHALSMGPNPLTRSGTNDFGAVCAAGVLSFVSGMIFPESSTKREEEDRVQCREPEPESEESSKGWSSGSSSSQGISEERLPQQQQRRNSVTKYSTTEEQHLSPEMDSNKSLIAKNQTNLSTPTPFTSSLATIASFGSELEIYPIREEDGDEDESVLIHRHQDYTPSESERKDRERLLSTVATSTTFRNSLDPEVQTLGEKHEWSSHSGRRTTFSHDDLTIIEDESRDDLLGGIQIVWAGDMQ